MLDYILLRMAFAGGALLGAGLVVRSWWRSLPDRLCGWIASRLPRRLVYFCGVRVLAEQTARERRGPVALSFIGRYIVSKEIRMWHALESWINRRP